MIAEPPVTVAAQLTRTEVAEGVTLGAAGAEGLTGTGLRLAAAAVGTAPLVASLAPLDNGSRLSRPSDAISDHNVIRLLGTVGVDGAAGGAVKVVSVVVG